MVLYINAAYMCVLAVERELCPLEKRAIFLAHRCLPFAEPRAPSPKGVLLLLQLPEAFSFSAQLETRFLNRTEARRYCGIVV